MVWRIVINLWAILIVRNPSQTLAVNNILKYKYITIWLYNSQLRCIIGNNFNRFFFYYFSFLPSHHTERPDGLGNHHCQLKISFLFRSKITIDWSGPIKCRRLDNICIYNMNNYGHYCEVYLCVRFFPFPYWYLFFRSFTFYYIFFLQHGVRCIIVTQRQIIVTLNNEP